MKFFVSWLAASFVPFVSGMATLALPTSANCGDQAVLTCTSTNCNSVYRFVRDSVIIYNHIGPQTGADPERYSGTITSNNQVQLSINKIELSDAGMYKCSCGFDLSSAAQTLQYQCKATTSKATITNEKKLSITVDRIYPQPSNVVTSLTSPINQLPGTYTCGSSPTVDFHYLCTWDSTISLPDGNHGYTITVTTSTEASPPVSGSFKIVTPTSPNISNLVTISTNRSALIGIQDSPLTIRCLSRGGIPAPTLAWYRGNTSTSPMAQSSSSDSVRQSDGTYTVTLTHIFTPRRADDLTTYLCRVFYPGATNEALPNPSPAKALLYIDLRPDNAKVLQTGETISGESMSVRCTSTNGRPAPSITWSYKGQTFTPTNTPIYNQMSDTYTVVSVLQRPVNAADNGQTATCLVSHTTLSVPLTEAITVDVKFGPPTGSTTVSGNLPTAAIGHNQIRLNCTSGSSNPASNITWYNGSNAISNVMGYNRWSGDNNGVVTSDNLTITPTRYMDGARITCRSDNGYGADSTYVDLDILYSPLIQPLLNITSTEGEPDVSIVCLASSKPPATFTWSKGDSVLATGTGTITHNSFSYVIPRVDRADAGSYQCKADNDVGSSDLKNVYLIVKYPPAVTVSTTLPLSYTITCTAEGYPDSYTYQDWVQIWPGYGPVDKIRFSGTTLNLTGATYERSGVYVCGVSNGVAVYGTDMKFMKGNATVLIKAPPVVTDPSPDGTRVLVAGRLGQDATTEIKYWSSVNDSIVKCYKSAGDSHSSSSSCSVTKTDTEVTLPVYNHMVKETGTLAIIKIHISSQEDMTAYDIVVSNSVLGESVLGISIVPQAPPEAPTLIGNFSITPNQVILTVVPGFHGGYNQTLVVQISTNLITWLNKTSVYVGQEYQSKDVILASLRENTLHYVRVFAYNIEGGSNNFSIVMNFTTAQDPSTASTASPPVALIGGTVGATCALLVLAVVLVVVWRIRKGGWMFSQKTDRRSHAKNQDTTESVECAMYVTAENVQPGISEKDVYSTPQKRERSDPPANVYAMVSKTKKDIFAEMVLAGKDKNTASTTEDNKGGKKRRKPGKPTEGLPECPHVAETTLDTRNTPTYNPPMRSMKNANADGLIYADLEFDGTVKNGVVHGLDNVTIYADIDNTKRAEPFADSDIEST